MEYFLPVKLKLGHIFTNHFPPLTYRVIRKSLRDFQPLRYSSQNGHAEGEHVNRGRDTKFMSYLTGAWYVHPWWCGRCQSCNQVPATHRRHMCTCSLCHMIYHSCDKGMWRQSLLSTARCCSVCGRNLITGLTSAVSPRVDISSTCKVGQKLGVSLPLLTCSPSAWPSQLLYCRGRKSHRDLWITLYYYTQCSLYKK
jgi:hypothetical protein